MNTEAKDLPEGAALEESFQRMERRIIQGLGPEAELVNVLKNSLAIEALARTDGGRALIRESMRRATEILQRMTADIPTPDNAFKDVLALSSEIGILRRIAAMIAVGRQAAQRIDEVIDEHGITDET